MATTWKLVDANHIERGIRVTIQEVVDDVDGEEFTATAERGNDIMLALKNEVLKKRDAETKEISLKSTIDLSKFDTYLKS